jgi:hypothetical protein
MTNHTQLIIRLKQMPRQGASAEDALNDLNNALKNAFNTYKQGAGDVLRENIFDKIASSVQQAYKEVNVLEQRNRGLAESFKVNTTRAAALGQEFDVMAQKLGVNADKLKLYAGELTKLIPGQTRFLKNAGGLGEKISKQMEEMRNKLGLSAEQYESLLKNQTLFANQGYSVASGMEKFNGIIREASEQYGTSFEAVEASVTEAVAAMDSEAAARFGKMSSKSFVEAVMGAKKLGIEMNKLLAIGDNFLDVESAIANELELQLLGAKELNVAEIQRAAYAGDANELQKQLTNFIAANGEQLKENPILLEKAASAFNMQKSELLDMYATYKLNNEAAKEAGNIATQNAQTAMDLRTEEEKLRDEANKKYVEELVKNFGTPEQMAEHVNKIATYAKTAQADALKGAAEIANTLSNSTFIQTMKSAVMLYSNLTGLKDAISSSPNAVVTDSGVSSTAMAKSDLFIPSNGSSIISGEYGSFTTAPGDDILAAPGIREAAGGAGTSALIAALSKMSFHVTNVFDGDKIKSQLEIRQGQTINNINNIA